ncbi:MAG: porphobilinogen synthase [Planctomycetota bacterium]
MNVDLTQRPRRNRKSAAIRDAIRETTLHASQLVYPLFVHNEAQDTPLDSLPGQTRWSLDGLVKEVGRCRELGLDKFALFPKIDDALKSRTGDEAFNPEGLIPRIIRAIKAKYPEVCLIADVALDPYNSDGHDGYVTDAGMVDNDTTLAILAKQAVCVATAGADVVAPSDMMDGRVGVIRKALDDAGQTEVSILSYAVKYASAYYGPFRGALDSAPKAAGDRPIPADKTTYQMDPANVREALREIALDEAEGADLVMVKPAGPYLDVVRAVREHTNLPVAAYQVSGEYLMLKAAAASGWLDERDTVLESLVGIRRAGANMIFTYFAPQVAAWLSEA